MKNELESIKGLVEQIIYSNDKNGWTVCDFETDDALICAVGYLPFITEGDSLQLFGSWGLHPTYGEQFKVEYYEKCEPSDKSSIEKYLASGIIKGVRNVTAKKIVAMFGTETFNILRTDPMQLTKIKGISPSRAMSIADSFNEQSGAQSVVMFLNKFGVTPNFALKIFSQYGADAVDKIKSNPYSLCSDISGIGFKKADMIGESLGFSNDDENRVCAGIEYILLYNSQNGHTYLPKDKLISLACQMLNIQGAVAENALVSLLMRSRLCSVHGDSFEKIYLYNMYWYERRSAQRLVALAKKPVTLPKNISDIISEAENECCITLEDSQRDAVMTAVSNNVSVITGGPGTGKTTIIKTLISTFDRLGMKAELCAPTGRAAKRMTQATGHEAKTIHRLLEMNYEDDTEIRSFARCERNPLTCDVVIVDEGSMIDIALFDSLTEALGNNTRLIIVGDSDQLPSVGAGNVLADIISSGHIKVSRLTEIFRQAKESMIVMNAHAINHGEYPKSGVDFFFIPVETQSGIVSSIVDLCQRRLPAKYEINDIFSIQVISPSKKGEAGVKNLNSALRDALNPPSPDKNEYKARENIYRTGDKVMQIKNNYNLCWESISTKDSGSGVFNGDVGIIEDVDKKNSRISVVFDGDKRVYYDFLQLDEIEPAFAMTVHKSQGSEFDIVVMPMYKAPPMLLYRNLLYTAITRAKKLVVLVGSEQIVKYMTDNNRQLERFSSLGDMICDIWQKDSRIY